MSHTRADGTRHRWSSGLATRWYLVRVCWAASPSLSALLGAAILFSGLASVAFILLTGHIVGQIGVVFTGQASRASVDVTGPVIALSIVFVLRHAVAPFQAQLARALGRRVDHRLSLEAMQLALEPDSIGHLEDPTFVDALARARGLGASQLSAGTAVIGLGGIATLRLQALGAAVLVGAFRWWLAVGLVVVLQVMRVSAWRTQAKVQEVVKGKSRVLRRYDYLRRLGVSREAAMELRLFGWGTWLRDRAAGTWREAMSAVWRERSDAERAQRPVLVAVYALAMTGTFVVLAVAGAHHEISLQQTVVVAQATLVLVAGLFTTNENDLFVAYGLAAAPALAEVRAAVGAVDKSGTVDAGGLPRTSIRFESISFRYPTSSVDLYRELDLEIPAGRSLAIVGRNGAGKTTIAKLLAGLYEPDAGQVLVDGIPLADIALDSWRRQLAVIFQDFVHYPLTLRENIAYGAVGRLDDDALAECLARAGGAPLVESLPAGWQTTLSPGFAGGVDLSGGQWQRVALARAFAAIEAGAKVLILDEPTASLDARMEAEFFTRFLEMTAGLTTIIVSHRFSTVRRADEICVLEEGRVIERGDHDALMRGGGRYAEMYRLQAAHFLDQPGADLTTGTVPS